MHHVQQCGEIQPKVIKRLHSRRANESHFQPGQFTKTEATMSTCIARTEGVKDIFLISHLKFQYFLTSYLSLLL